MASRDEIRVAVAAEKAAPDILAFLRAMIAIPSESAGEAAVIERIAREMRKLHFDEVRLDAFGNVLGRVGHGPRVIAVDGHVDTVGVGDRGTWAHDPYAGQLDHGIVYGRGASDQEAGVAAAVYGAHIAKDLGLLDGITLWVTATVMEEDCDGLCWQYLLKEEVLSPEVVVITEPTNLAVYRGHRGRMEIEVRAQGRSAHGSAPERGDNAVYKMAPIIGAVQRLHAELSEHADPFLGPGSVTISDIRSTSPSLCAVADSCTIYLDRRLTRGETLEGAVSQIQNLPEVRAAGATVTVPEYQRPTHTGYVLPTRKYYPTWVIEESHPAVEAAVSVATGVLGARPAVGKWVFSTNGVATCGLYGVPTIGFGPANEVYAHTPDDQCPLEHLPKAAAFYALFPQIYTRLARPEKRL
ncbi:MAG: YgeY family selenium metabolism-linked hydrolase [Polyangiaceae bacterium]|nr:YgeY family selenium metabolism-linked hydrolase [Polyangiaceae bacterium]